MTAQWLAVVHHLPERTRLRSPLLRRDPAACERLAECLVDVDGVIEVRVRPYTGSALVMHRPDLATPKLVGEAARCLGQPRVLAPGEAPPVSDVVPAFSSLARKLVAATRELDREIRRKSDGSVDLGTLAAFGFAGAGALEVATTGQLPMPPWFNLAWWAFRTFVTTEQEEIQAEVVADP